MVFFSIVEKECGTKQADDRWAVADEEDIEECWYGQAAAAQQVDGWIPEGAQENV